jgi:dolichyl-diphosphooligosaccharide--protein glycosyltransferase
MLPLHAFVLVLMGRFSTRLYVAYSSFYLVGTLASMQVPFVGFLPVRTSEHMAALGVFGLLQLVAFVELVRSHVPSKQFTLLLRLFVAIVFVASFAALVGLTYGGYIAPWNGRFYSLWDTGYARKHIPIISSVSEHQPPAWPAFFFDLQMLVWLFPAGIFLLFRELRDEHIFVIIYAVMGSYFASVMVRLMLTLTPVVCVAAAIAVSSILDAYMDPQEPETRDTHVQQLLQDDADTKNKSKTGKKGKGDAGPSTSTAAVPADASSPVNGRAGGSAASAADAAKPWTFRHSPKMLGVYGLDSRAIVIVYTTLMLLVYVLHCTFVTSTAYSSPSIVLASRNPDGSQHIIDDFREAYDWLRRNSAQDAKVMSWWDYGYQIALYSDRTTLVDNNTWNNTHIATVGKAMSSPEDKAYAIMQKHDVDYVLVMFGGLLGYSGDDINKFLWMIRIAQGIWPEDIREADFFTPQGQYRIDDGASKTMRESMMYKMSYYRFNELFGGQAGVDRVRGQSAATVGPTLDYIEEAFTSENWIVRIYEVKKPDPLGRDLPAANAFEKGKRRKRAAVAPRGSAGSTKGKRAKA